MKTGNVYHQYRVMVVGGKEETKVFRGTAAMMGEYCLGSDQFLLLTTALIYLYGNVSQHLFVLMAIDCYL